MRISQLGWVAAAALVGVGVGTGSQAKSEKLGFVDMQVVYEDSNLKKKNDDRLRSAQQNRQAALDFLRLFPSFTDEQLARYKLLATKESLTPAESAELAKLKTDVQAATKQFDDLRKKPNPSAQDLKTLNDLGALNDADQRVFSQWGNEFNQDIQKMQGDTNLASIEALRQAIAQVAKVQGFSLVFRENIAVYGSHDLASDVKKALDKNTK